VREGDRVGRMGGLNKGVEARGTRKLAANSMGGSSGVVVELDLGL
jgi:hypothetical protein